MMRLSPAITVLIFCVTRLLCEENVCDDVPEEERLDCYLDGRDRTYFPECERRGCCWQGPEMGVMRNPKVPTCFYPRDFFRYSVTGITRKDDGIDVYLRRMRQSGIQDDVMRVLLRIEYYGEYIVRLTFLNESSDRFIPPMPELGENTFLQDKAYEVDVFTTGELVISRPDGAPVFKTSLSMLLFADQLLELPIFLPSDKIYGLEEHLEPLLRPTNWTSYFFFNQDKEPKPGTNLYGSHPMYLCLEKGGQAHGVFLRNSGPVEVFLQPMPLAIFRALGGILDFFVFLGPTPAAVVQQYQHIVGKPAMPPYWALGFHLSRDGYGTVNNTYKVLMANVKAGIHVEAIWNSFEYTRTMAFNYDSVLFGGIRDLASDVHGEHRYYVLNMIPTVHWTYYFPKYPPYDDAVAMNLFMKMSNGRDAMGRITLPYDLYIDFTSPNATPYWTKQFQLFHDRVPFDGVWLSYTSPLCHCQEYHACSPHKWNRPPYNPTEEILTLRTPCLTHQLHIGAHYNVHNLYAYYAAMETYKALATVREKRPFVLSAASFTGQGKWSGHWTGDISSTWEHMRATIPAILTFGLHGMPLVGADICGYAGNTTEELCARWHALGAFYPFSRNHNAVNARAQDPRSMGPLVVDAAIKAMFLRYSLLPYLYTLFYRSHAYGETVARPLFYEFPEDDHTHSIETQFMWGPALLISPVLYPKQKEVYAYVPPGVWYDYYRGTRVISRRGRYIKFAANEAVMPLLIRGGYIIPYQEPGATTYESRSHPLGLLIAPDGKGKASGQLFWDDGESLDTVKYKLYTLYEFNLRKGVLVVSLSMTGYTGKLKLRRVTIMGVNEKPMVVRVRGMKVLYVYDSKNRVLEIPDALQKMDRDFSISWM